MNKIHYSMIAMFHRCAFLFYLVYILGLRRAPGLALGIGTSLHTPAEKNLKAKMTTGLLLSEEEVAETARDVMAQWWDEVTLQYDKPALTEEEEAKGVAVVKAESIDLSVALATTHHRELAPIIEPAAVEEKWVLELNGFPVSLAGTIDVIEKSGRVRDLKSSGKAPAPDTANKSLQLTMYALQRYAETQDVPVVGLDFVVKTKVPRVVTQLSTRTTGDFQLFLRRLEAFSLALEKEVFPPCDPGNYLCSPRWCGFYGNECKYTGGKG